MKKILFISFMAISFGSSIEYSNKVYISNEKSLPICVNEVKLKHLDMFMGFGEYKYKKFKNVYDIYVGHQIENDKFKVINSLGNDGRFYHKLNVKYGKNLKIYTDNKWYVFKNKFINETGVGFYKNFNDNTKVVSKAGLLISNTRKININPKFSFEIIHEKRVNENLKFDGIVKFILFKKTPSVSLEIKVIFD